MHRAACDPVPTRMSRYADVLPPPQSRSIAVTLINLKYSPNLGDGIIAECLEREIARRLPEAAIVTLDLAGRRDGPPRRRSRGRIALLSVLQGIPQWLGELLLSIALRPVLRKLRSRWAEVLRNTDIAVFGGGQLIQDGDLNFPLKLAAAAAECRVHAVPIILFAVGAAPSRSRRGRQLLSTLIQSPDLIHVAARDEWSARELLNRGADPVWISRDPGLLATRHWPARRASQHSRPRIGLCITHPAVLRHHSASGLRHDSEELCRLYPELTRLLVACGYDVVLFSNGAAEDERLKEAVHRATCGPDILRVVSSSRCRTPAELVRLIAGLDFVVAHRLHACIVAFSYRIPAIGLQWDDKLKAFFSDIGKPHFAVPFDRNTISEIPGLLVRARAEPVPENHHRRMLAETDDALDRLAEALIGAARSKAYAASLAA
jgi:polysaccharide pyruvyl transferase WcaK-like protein